MKKKFITLSLALIFSVIWFGFVLSGCSQGDNISLANGYYKFAGAERATNKVLNGSSIKQVAVSSNAFAEQDRLARHFEHDVFNNVEFQLNGQPVSLRGYLENAYEEAVARNPLGTLEGYLQFEYDDRFVTMLGHDLTAFLQEKHPDLDLNYNKTLQAVRDALPYTWWPFEWRSTDWNATDPDMVYIGVQQEEWITEEISSVNSLSEADKTCVRISICQFFAGIDDMAAYVRETLRWNTRRQLAKFGYELDLSEMTAKELIIIRSLYTQILPFANTVFEVEGNNITVYSQIWFGGYWDFDTFSLLHESELYLPVQTLRYTFDLHEPSMTWNAFDPIEVCTVNLYKNAEPVQEGLPAISVYNGKIIRFFDWLMPGYISGFEEFKMIWSLQ